jgi:hypothetical protein
VHGWYCTATWSRSCATRFTLTSSAS